MRMPRLRFTIGRLMLVVVVAGLASWSVHVYRKLQIPTASELQAQASYKQALLVREVAEYAVKEYKEGIDLQDKATSKGQVEISHSDWERAIERLEGSPRMLNEGQLSPRTRDAFLRTPTFSREQAQFALEQAKTQPPVLEEYTKEKQIKSLKSDVEEARADEQAKLEAYCIERAKRWRWGIMGF
jgi:HlyD family secretion protein